MESRCLGPICAPSSMSVRKRKTEGHLHPPNRPKFADRHHDTFCVSAFLYLSLILYLSLPSAPPLCLYPSATCTSATCAADTPVTMKKSVRLVSECNLTSVQGSYSAPPRAAALASLSHTSHTSYMDCYTLSMSGAALGLFPPNVLSPPQSAGCHRTKPQSRAPCTYYVTTGSGESSPGQNSPLVISRFARSPDRAHARTWRGGWHRTASPSCTHPHNICSALRPQVA